MLDKFFDIICVYVDISISTLYSFFIAEAKSVKTYNKHMTPNLVGTPLNDHVV